MEDSIVPGTELELGTTTNVPEVAEQVEPATEVVESSEPKTLRDAVVKAFEKNAKDTTAALPQLGEPDAQKADPAKETDPITGREVEPIRAPSSMTPLLREKWGTVPREMQKFWVDRERDMQTKLQDTASERKLANEFSEIVAPYSDMFRTHGTNAVEHTKQLLNLDSQLRSGSGATKAQIIHSLITHFKPDMQTLVQLANGQQPAPQAQQAPDVQALVRKEMDAQAAAQAEAKQTSEIQREFGVFAADPKNEFVADLQPLMIKAMEAGFVGGNDFPELFRNAYDFAVNAHPEIKQIVASRANSAVQTPATQTAKPVQSVKPSLVSGGRGGQTQPRPKSLREAAEMAWNKHAGN